MNRATAWVASAAIALPTLFAQSDTGVLANEARDLSRSYVETLKPELLSAVERKGLAEAIDFCSQRAPEIAAALGAQSGWEVKRVSLKPRNANLANPDDWETAALLRLEAANKAGADPSQLEVFETVDGTFRYLKAQPVGPLCLNCHGKDITSDVAEALKTFYPSDQATGYALGEIRGAISLRKAID